MRIERLWKWRARRRFGKGFFLTHWMTEEEAKAQHPDAVAVSGTMLEVEVPETEEERAKRNFSLMGDTSLR